MSRKSKTKITRWEFIRDASAATLGGSLLLSSGRPLLAATEDSAAKSTSDVILVRNPDVLDANGAPRPEIVLEMLDAAVSRLTGEKDAGDGWRMFIKPTDVVGIKSNVWGPLPTTTAVEQGLKTRVMGAGVADKDIAISDRGVLRDPVFQRATALINARPMRSHHWSGVGSLIKNYIMFVPDPFNYHENACSRLGEIWTNPLVKDKTRLNVLVMFTPQFHCVGPHGFSPRYVWQYHGLLVGFDPVAVDTTGLKIIQGIRNEYFGEERPLSPPATHIAVADTTYHLGTSEPGRIKLVKLGHDEKSFC